MEAELDHQACILIVDDEPGNVRLLARMVRSAGFTCVHATTSSREGLSLFSSESPDIVLLDLRMPEMDGMELMRRMRAQLDPDEFVPMVMLTGDLSPDVREHALDSGAIDFITKPYQIHEVRLRIRNLLHMRVLHRELKLRNAQLTGQVQHRTWELEEARLDLLDRLALAAEFRDDATGQHTQRVGALSCRLALELGFAPGDAERLGRAAMLHDIGKIGIPDSILLKPDRLTPDEFDVIRQHTTIGRDILSGSPAPLLQVAEVIAYTHHERWDGGGYNSMAADDIPAEGRIVTVVDTFDALVNDRPYRHACSLDVALDEMRRHRGTQFDPGALDAFIGLIEREGVATMVEKGRAGEP